MKKYFAILFLCLFVATFCQAQAKVEKAECDTTNYNLTMVLSYLLSISKMVDLE